MPEQLDDMVCLDRSRPQSEYGCCANAQQPETHHNGIQWGTYERMDPQGDRAATEGSDESAVCGTGDGGFGNGSRNQSAITADCRRCGFVGATFGRQPQLIHQGSQQRKDGHGQLACEQVAMVLLVQVRSLVGEQDLPLSRLEHIEHAL